MSSSAADSSTRAVTDISTDASSPLIGAPLSAKLIDRSTDSTRCSWLMTKRSAGKDSGREAGASELDDLAGSDTGSSCKCCQFALSSFYLTLLDIDSTLLTVLTMLPANDVSAVGDQN